MPHLVKPRQLWVTYAPDAPFDERRQVRGLVRGLRERGIKKRELKELAERWFLQQVAEKK